MRIQEAERFVLPRFFRRWSAHSRRTIRTGLTSFVVKPHVDPHRPSDVCLSDPINLQPIDTDKHAFDRDLPSEQV